MATRRLKPLPKKSISGLPKTLKILGKRFRIHFLEEDESTDVDGLMELFAQRISIRPQEAREQVQDTALHECIHAIDESLSLGMTEAQVHQMATALLGFLKDNVQFTRWLLQSDDAE